jgi:hypothetical protein
MEQVMINQSPTVGAAIQAPRPSDTPLQRALWVLWPAFMVAAVAELLFFALVDPSDLHLFGVPVDAERMSVYTVGFLAFWALCSASGALTVFLQRSPYRVNHCPIHPEDRPEQCAVRSSPAGCARCD